MIDRIVVWALTLKARASDARGQDVLEYALLGGLIAMAIMAVAALEVFTGAISDMFTGIGECIDFTEGGCAPF